MRNRLTLLVLFSFSLIMTSCSQISDIGPIERDSSSTDVRIMDSTYMEEALNDGADIGTSEFIEPDERSSIESIVYESGVWHVNRTIPPGLYRVVLDSPTGEGLAIVERSSGYEFEDGDIIAYGTFWGHGYVRISDTDVAVRVQYGHLEFIDEQYLRPDIKTVVYDGVYIVNVDIKPGLYSIELTAPVIGLLYVGRLSDLTMSGTDLLTDESYRESETVRVEASDYAVKIQGAKLTYIGE